MKTANIFLLSFIVFLSSCSLYDRFIDNNTYVANAGYRNWTEPPEQGDVPEKGTDLAVIVRHWPEGASPSYIIYDNWKSMPAKISSEKGEYIVIDARIIKSSSVLNKTSEDTLESDRLVYTDSEGKEKYMKIDEWTSIEEMDSLEDN